MATTIRIKPDLLLGRIAVELKLVTPEALAACIDEQERERREGHRRFLGEILVERKLLTPRQLDDILIAQIYAEVRSDDGRFGHLAVANGMATQEQVDACVAKRDAIFQREKTVVTLGQVMRDAGVLTDQQVEALLRAQGRLTGHVFAGRCALCGKSVAPDVYLCPACGGRIVG